MLKDIVSKVTYRWFIAGFLLLIFVFIFSLLSFIIHLNRSNWAYHTDQVLIELESMLSNLKDAETGQRGFLLTKNPAFLEPYIGSYNKVFQNYKNVKNLTSDNEKQQGKLDTLIGLIENKYLHTETTVKLSQQGKMDSALYWVETGRGRTIMDKIRILVKGLKAEEIRLRSLRFKYARIASLTTACFILTASVLSFLFGYVLLRKIDKETRERIANEEEVKRLNEELQDANVNLRSAEVKLKNYNTDLVGQVQDRTVKLEEKNEELNVRNEDLDNFVYTASHDLKAPISNIEGLITAIQDEMPQHCLTNVSHLLGMAITSTEKLKSTIEDLETVSVIHSNVLHDIGLLRIDELLEEVRKDLFFLIQTNKVNLDVKLEANEIRFSRSNLKTILKNLVSNAIKYKHPDRDPYVSISSVREEGYITIIVKDNGLGIRPEHKSKVFKMFKRFSAHSEGSGIGLYLVKRIVDNVKGKIELNSEPGEGAEFIIYLKDQH